MPVVDWLARTFLEEPWAVYLLLGIAEIVLAIIWYERRTRRCAFLLAVPPSLAVAVFAIATLVVTDREQIIAAADQICSEISRGDFDAVGSRLDDDFSGYWLDKQAALVAGKAAAGEFGIAGVSITQKEVTVAGRNATMQAMTVITFRHPGETREQRTALVWDIGWVKRDGKWLIRTVQEPRAALGLPNTR